MRGALAIVLSTLFLALLPRVASADTIIWEYQGTVSSASGTISQLIPVGAPASMTLTLVGADHLNEITSSCRNCTQPPDYYGWYHFAIDMHLGDVDFTGAVLMEVNFNLELDSASSSLWRFWQFRSTYPIDTLYTPPPGDLFGWYSGGSGPAFPLGQYIPPQGISQNWLFVNQTDLPPWGSVGVSVQLVPEPASLLLLGTGLVGLGRAWRKRRA